MADKTKVTADRSMFIEKYTIGHRKQFALSEARKASCKCFSVENYIW